MSEQAITLEAVDDVHVAYGFFRRFGVRLLPVLEEHRVVGY
ncbi:hypothetical protein ACWDSD_19525 [Streptomyces spiralis]